MARRRRYGQSAKKKKGGIDMGTILLLAGGALVVYFLASGKATQAVSSILPATKPLLPPPTSPEVVAKAIEAGGKLATDIIRQVSGGQTATAPTQEAWQQSLQVSL
jgi:hypothetical protein